MLTYLPWVTLALLLALLFVRERSSANGANLASRLPDLRVWALTGIIVVLAVAIASTKVPQLQGRMPIVAGFLGLTLAAFLLNIWLAKDGPVLRLVAIGEAVFGALLIASQTAPKPPMVAVAPTLALTVVGLCSLSLWIAGGGTLAGDVVVALFAGACATVLGVVGPGGKTANVGAVLPFAALLAGSIGYGIGIAFKKTPRVVCGGVAVLLFGSACALLAWRFFFIGDMATLALAGILASLVCAWFIPADGSGKGYRYVVGALVFLGVATVAFTLRRGFGMSVVCQCAVLTALIVGNRRVFPAMAPLLALTFYRTFREAFPDATRAFDIGQHYAIVGLFLGVIFVLGCVDWAQSVPYRARLRAMLAASPAGLALLLLTLGSLILLGPKGAVGLLLGFGIAPLFGALAEKPGLGSTLWGMTLMAVAALGYGPLSALADTPKPVKAAALGAVVVVAALLALAAWLLARLPKKEAQQ